MKKLRLKTLINEADYLSEVIPIVVDSIRKIRTEISTIEDETRGMPNNYLSPQKRSLDKIKTEIDNLKRNWSH